jgi:hypothetical protein
MKVEKYNGYAVIRFMAEYLSYNLTVFAGYDAPLLETISYKYCPCHDCPGCDITRYARRIEAFGYRGAGLGYLPVTITICREAPRFEDPVP